MSTTAATSTVTTTFDSDEFDQFKASSKAYIAVLMLYYLAYAIFDIIRFFKTDGGKESPQSRVAPFFRVFIYVTEKDMAVPLLVVTAVIVSRAFFAFMAVMTYILIIFGILLMVARLKENKMIQTISKIGIVVLVIVSFINLFVNDHVLSEVTVA